MPQMAPLNWLILLIYFMTIFLMFNVMNYFSFLYNIKSSTSKKIKINYN
uniref:ATP synthase complex subunit 8 n=1 Tax=Xenostrongylus variegatus TaxID=2748664 RepID=A0A8F0HXU7_9CUCU|nr:ATP synthase F0 subunit 8 [Xenostrongylus variegatus]